MSLIALIGTVFLGIFVLIDIILIDVAMNYRLSGAISRFWRKLFKKKPGLIKPQRIAFDSDLAKSLVCTGSTFETRRNYYYFDPATRTISYSDNPYEHRPYMNLFNEFDKYTDPISPTLQQLRKETRDFIEGRDIRVIPTLRSYSDFNYGNDSPIRGKVQSNGTITGGTIKHLYSGG